MSTAVVVTCPELVLAVEVCKDPGQKDSVLRQVGERVKNHGGKRIGGYPPVSSNMAGWKIDHRNR